MILLVIPRCFQLECVMLKFLGKTIRYTIAQIGYVSTSSLDLFIINTSILVLVLRSIRLVPL